jgi:hypothetical protein
MSGYDYGKPQPFPDEAMTGRKFVSPCCTSAVVEFLVDGELWVCGRVAGHSYSSPRKGSVDDINDDGYLCGPGNEERQVHWNPRKEKDHA